MKRVCNTKEKELLFKNRNQILKGIYKTSAKGKYGDIFVGIFVSTLVMFAGIFVCLTLFDKHADVAFYVWVAFSFTIPNMITRKIMSGLRAKKETKKFFKKDDLMMNGATIVAIDSARGKFSYMEDDLLDADGNPVIIDYPEIPSDFGTDMLGKRLIVMYDGEASFQLLKVNDELAGLIQNDSKNNFFEKPLNRYRHVPHPNALNINFCEHKLTEGEKEKYAKEYIDFMQKDARKGLKIGGIIYFVGIMIVSVVYGILEDCLAKSMFVGLAIFTGLAVFVLLMSLLGKVGMKKTARFTHVKEVIFHSNVIEQSGKSVSSQLVVYEWTGDKFELGAYHNAAVKGDIPYGSVLIKFTNQKGKVIFMKKEMGMQ